MIWTCHQDWKTPETHATETQQQSESVIRPHNEVKVKNDKRLKYSFWTAHNPEKAM